MVLPARPHLLPIFHDRPGDVALASGCHSCILVVACASPCLRLRLRLRSSALPPPPPPPSRPRSPGAIPALAGHRGCRSVRLGLSTAHSAASSASCACACACALAPPERRDPPPGLRVRNHVRCAGGDPVQRTRLAGEHLSQNAPAAEAAVAARAKAHGLGGKTGRCKKLERCWRAQRAAWLMRRLHAPPRSAAPCRGGSWQRSSVTC